MSPPPPRNKSNVDRAKDMVSVALRKAVDNGHLVSPVDPTRLLYLRTSQLPFCPMRTFFEMPRWFTKAVSNDFSMSFYTRVGHAVHAVMQETLHKVSTSQSYTLNDWICLNPECKHRHPLKRLIKTCRKCGGTKLFPDEHRIDLPWIRGHIDTILVNGHTAVIVDYKTTSSKSVNSKSGSEVNYTTQIGSYCTLMKPVLAEMGIDLIGWALVYVARDNFVMKVVTGDNFTPLAQLKEWSKQHQGLLNLKSKSEVRELVANRICKTKDDNEKFDRWCVHKSRCVNTDSECMKAATEIYVKLEGKLPIKNKVRSD